MSIAPLVTLFTSLLTQGQLLVPFVAGAGLMLAGGVLALGNHQRGKEGIICALIGAAVMISAPAIGQSLHA